MITIINKIFQMKYGHNDYNIPQKALIKKQTSKQSIKINEYYLNILNICATLCNILNTQIKIYTHIIQINENAIKNNIMKLQLRRETQRS